MSARRCFCLSIFAVFCVSVSSCSSVEWKNQGEAFTIKCECKEEVVLLNVKKGLKKNVDIFYKHSSPRKAVVAYPDRMQYDGSFPNFQILLKNLTSNDTGVYWCVYRADGDVDCEGSVLLVVRDDKHEAKNSTGSCESNKNLVLIFVIISTSVLLAIFIALLLLAIRKVKYCQAKIKPSRIPRNDVYEDMRGTTRR